MFIKGVSHQLELITSILLFIHCHHNATHTYIVQYIEGDRKDRDIVLSDKTKEKKKGTRVSYCNIWISISYIVHSMIWSMISDNDPPFHIGIQLKRVAWLSTNHLIRLKTLNLYVWHNIISNKRFHIVQCPKVCFYSKKKKNSIEIFYQCLRVDLHNINQKREDDIDRQKWWWWQIYYYSSWNGSVIEHAMCKFICNRLKGLFLYKRFH